MATTLKSRITATAKTGTEAALVACPAQDVWHAAYDAFCDAEDSIRGIDPERAVDSRDAADFAAAYTAQASPVAVTGGIGSMPAGWTHIPVAPDVSTPARYDFWHESD